MNRRSYLRRVGGSIGGVAVASVAGCVGSQDDTYENPVFEPTMADPTITRASDGTFYVYGTEDHWGFDDDRPASGWQIVPVARSTDLVDWEYVGEAFDDKPDWKNEGHIWAPDIAQYRDRYYLYYSYSVWGDDNPGIGVATADDPAGPFEDHGKLFQSDEIAVRNSIDPQFYEHDGTPYVVWGSFNGIYGVELTDDGLDWIEDTRFQIAGRHFEAPYIIEREGTYYFFGSNGSCCDYEESSYHVTVGRSDSFFGPYENQIETDLLDYSGSPILEGNDEFVGPGHNSIVQDDAGTDWIVYHAYERDNPRVGATETPRRTLMIDPIEWEDGWPTVEGGEPSSESPVPEIDE